MRYISLRDGTPKPFTVSPQTLYREIAPICWPWPCPDSVLADWGVHPVLTEAPDVAEYETAQEDGYEADAKGVWRVRYVVSRVDIDQYEVQLHRRIDRACGEVRKQFITDIPGQSATYTIKEEEARAYAQDPSGSYPFLEAEALNTKSDIRDVASQIAGIAEQWRQLGAEIEGLRIGAKRGVSLARERGDYEAMRAATDIQWPVPKA